MAVKHGAYSAQLVSAKAEEVRAELLNTVPWLIDADAFLLDRYCRAEARIRMLTEHFLLLADEQGVRAIPKTVKSEIAREETVSLRLAPKLGLTMTGYARLIGRAAKARDLDRLVLLVLGERVKTADLSSGELRRLRERLAERVEGLQPRSRRPRRRS
jgi:hypothetical protein